MNLIGDLKQYEVDPASSDYLQLIQNTQHPKLQIYPYPYLNSLRNRYGHLEGTYQIESETVSYSAFLEYEDIDSLLRHSAVRRSMRLSEKSEEFAQFAEQNLYVQMMNDMMLVRDPPDHTRLRKLVSKPFTRARVASMAGAIKDSAHALIDRFAKDRKGELIGQYAYHLPVSLISELLGLPESDHAMFRRWTKDIDVALAGLDNSPEIWDRLNAAAREQKDYFHEVFTNKSKYPQDDLISELLVSEDNGDKLSENELCATCFLLLSAGHATTTNAIGLALLHLFRFPGELQTIKDNPEVLEGGVDELLRYDAVIGHVIRYAAEDIEYRGLTIPKGRTMFFFLNAGNRDPKVFDDPDVLDLSRRNVQSLTFGRGHHFCLGAALSKLEMKIALQILLERIPDLRPERISFPQFMLFRGPDEFHFKF